MSLTLVATPIGNSEDISIRGLATLKKADVIILEEFKESTQFLRAHQISGKQLEQLNEHTTQEELEKLKALCRDQNVALITDCGTPGFADPGAHLVALCRQNNISVVTLPGASSLMGLLSLSSERLDQFLFRGFLPAETISRKAEWEKLQNEKRAIVIMDTPYRLTKTLLEIKEHFSKRKFLITINLTQNDELIYEGHCEKINLENFPTKAEFMILIYPNSLSSKKNPATK